MKYNINNEYINIDNYSPFSHVNEVSSIYRSDSFLLPIVNVNDSIVPVHPDTFSDLRLKEIQVLFYIKVYPTASYRTVYYKEKNIFIKLPLMRKITRGIRNLPRKELDRAKLANELLDNINIKYFDFLREIPIYNEDENYNYIIRRIPDKKLTPLFTLIKKQEISSKRMVLIIKRMIDIWLELASNNIYLEFHTQNILVDSDNNIYYRDLSDVRSIKYNIKPSYSITDNDLMTLSFDKTFCTQNLKHIFNYYKDIKKDEIVEYIKSKIKYYNLSFPDYSLMYDLHDSKRIPVKVEKIDYR